MRLEPTDEMKKIIEIVKPYMDDSGFDLKKDAPKSIFDLREELCRLSIEQTLCVGDFFSARR